MNADKSRAGYLGAAARHGFAPTEAQRLAEMRLRVLLALTPDPQPLPVLARRAGVSVTGTRNALKGLSRRRGARAEYTPEGWRSA